MKRKLWPYALIYLIGLLAAYAAVKPGEPEGAGQILARIPRHEIAKIILIRDDVNASLEPLREDLAWIEHRKGEGEAKRFLSNDRLKDIWKALDPLMALKAIGEQSKLADFGLENPSGKLRVELRDGKQMEFQLGKRGFQSSEIFVLSSEQKGVFLLDYKPLGLLETAPQRLALESPFQGIKKSLKAVKLEAGNRNLRWLKAEEGGWSREGGATDPAFGAWMDKLLKLRIEAYPNIEQVQAISGHSAKLAIELTGDDGKARKVRFVEENPESYWLQDEALPSPVLLERMKLSKLLAEFEALLPKAE